MLFKAVGHSLAYQVSDILFHALYYILCFGDIFTASATFLKLTFIIYEPHICQSSDRPPIWQPTYPPI